MLLLPLDEAGGVKKASGINVEILIQSALDTIWRLTQDPDRHQCWELRFTRMDICLP
jgi:hypothetical protein